MSDNLKLQFPKLQFICELKSLKTRKLVLAELGKDINFCKAVREVVRNTIKQNVSLPEKDKKKLRKYKRVIVSLGRKRKCTKRTSELMQQTGTGIFLPIVIPIVAGLIADLLKPKS